MLGVRAGFLRRRAGNLAGFAFGTKEQQQKKKNCFVSIEQQTLLGAPETHYSLRHAETLRKTPTARQNGSTRHSSNQHALTTASLRFSKSEPNESGVGKGVIRRCKHVAEVAIFFLNNTHMGLSTTYPHPSFVQ